MASYRILVLLASEADQPYLKGLIDSFAPDLRVLAVTSEEGLLALPTPALDNARLVAFASPVLVPPSVLSALGFGAYNIHLGSSQFPGWDSATRAHAARVKTFGATAHVMRDKPCTGAIVAVELAHVPAGITLPHLQELTYTAAARLFWKLAEPLAGSSDPLPTLPIRWGVPLKPKSGR